MRFLSGMTVQRINAIIILLFVMLLSSCGHVAHKDGPPNFYVDETKIPNAVPKPEPLAKYGNMSSYRVFGKRYYTLKSSKNYEAVGVASWYGTLFHARRTSSGEPYNMLAMTAAHKTLPLPTYVEVTNLKNQRKIIVKVNDRGPFESNRLIDLSYVAAKKLGMLGHGTTKVKIKAIDPYTYDLQQPSFDPLLSFDLANAKSNTRKTYASRKVHQTANTQLAKNTDDAFTEASKPSWQNIKSNHPMYLQVGAFRNKSHAERLKQRLIAMFQTPVKISNPSANGKLYRVKIGPIKDVAMADKITNRLKGLGIKPNKTYGA